MKKVSQVVLFHFPKTDLQQGKYDLPFCLQDYLTDTMIG